MLSSRLKPNIDAYPWVIEEVKQMEAELSRLTISARGAFLALDILRDEQTALHSRLAELVKALVEDVPSLLKWLPSPLQMADKDVEAEKNVRKLISNLTGNVIHK